MRFGVTTDARPKIVAKNLKETLKVHGIDIPLTTCHSLVSRMYGYRNWLDLKANIGKEGRGTPDADLAPNDLACRTEKNVLILVDFGVPLKVAQEAIGIVRPTGSPQPAQTLRFHSSSFLTEGGELWTGGAVSRNIDLVFSPPGKAKTAYLNAVNWDACLSSISSKGTSLPRIGIIDIGPSSLGMISLLQKSLPPDRRHEAEYVRIKMTRDFAINPFDTQLGVRSPIPSERSLLVNLITAFGTPAFDSNPHPAMQDLAGFAIERVYQRFDDLEPKSMPKRYQAQADTRVDKALSKHNVKIRRVTPWWEIVDALFEAGDYRHAVLAQRHAVPCMKDLVATLDEQSLKSVFEHALHGSGTPIVQMLIKGCEAAIADCPLLQCETRLDIGEARVVSLDMEEITPRGSMTENKLSTMSYLLARSLIGRDFHVDPDLIHAWHRGHELIPDIYRDYHADRMREIKDSPKRLVFDEFHRVSSNWCAREQVMDDMRSGRRQNLHIMVGSQMLADFHPSMVDMTTGIWITGVANGREAKKAADIFNISDSGREIMENRLTGSTANGNPFLAVLFNKEGRQEHFLVHHPEAARGF